MRFAFAGVVAALSLSGCGLIDQDGSNDGTSDGGSDGNGASRCTEGWLRLSTSECGSSQRTVERCEGGEWSTTDECRSPDGCDDGEFIPSGGICGDSRINLRGVACSGELLQESGCLCGAAEAVGHIDWPESEIGTQEDADALAGLPYLASVYISASAEPGIRGLDGIRCADDLTIDGESPAFRGLIAVRRIRFGQSQVPKFGALRTVEFLTFSNGVSDISEFSTVREIPVQLNVFSEVQDLDAFKELEVLGGFYANTSTLRSIATLSKIEEVPGNFLVTESAEDFSLHGVENLKRVGGKLTVPIATRAELELLTNLEFVGEDIEIWWQKVPETGLDTCSIGAFFASKEVGGRIKVYDLTYDPERC